MELRYEMFVKSHQNNESFYIETYGCRMNICDSEVIVAILSKAGMKYVNSMSDADVIILNSCSVREDGHNKIYERLTEIGKMLIWLLKLLLLQGVLPLC